jgi:hypothetical protein
MAEQNLLIKNDYLVTVDWTRVTYLVPTSESAVARSTRSAQTSRRQPR